MLKGEIKSNTIIVGTFNIPFSMIDHSDTEPTQKEQIWNSLVVQCVKGSGIVTAVAWVSAVVWVQSSAPKLLHAVSARRKKNL